MASSRRLADRACEQCGAYFRPARSSARYCSRRCSWANNGGQNKKAESWWVDAKGYIQGRVTLPDGSRRKVKQHRWLMEQHLGRPLMPHEHVHHVNGDKADNRIQNLMVIEAGKHSSRHHHAEREYVRGYKARLSDDERRARSERAKSMNLSALGRAAIAEARGNA